MAKQPPTREAFRPVMEDLQHLRDDWSEGPRDAVLRRGSVILRGFFDGLLQRAWKGFGFNKEPFIVAPNLDLLVGADTSMVEVALAGGGQTPGIYAAGFMLERRATPSNPYPPPDVLEFPFPLSAYPGFTSALAGPQRVTRKDVVKYFANVKGGAHLALSPLKRKEEEQLVRRVSRLEQRISVVQRDGLYFELMSIGQAVAGSKDVLALLGVMESILPVRARKPAMNTGGHSA